MECAEARFSLYALLDDELDVATNLEVLSHLDHCAACQRELELDERLRILVRERFSIASPSAGLWQKIARRIDAEKGEQGRLGRGLGGFWSKLRPFPATTAALAALMVLSLSLLFIYSKGERTHLADEIVQDHLRSLQKENGPVDFPSTNLAAIARHFREKFPVRSRVPSSQGLRLLGGSLCQIGQSKGIRLTYEMEKNRKVSFYQLEKSPTAASSRPGSQRPYSRESERPGIVLWEDKRLLYALVAELPSEKLQKLASQMQDI